MKTIIISSSLSKNSKSFILCKEVEKKLKEKKVEVKLLDLRDFHLTPTHIENSKEMNEISKEVSKHDNVIFGMGVHCYSINDSLKILLDNCLKDTIEGKFFGILCAAGGDRSYLSTMHLTQICMNEFRMIQLPRIVYATGRNFDNGKIISEDIIERIDLFVEEFCEIGNKLA